MYVLLTGLTGPSRVVSEPTMLTDATGGNYRPIVSEWQDAKWTPAGGWVSFYQDECAAEANRMLPLHRIL